MRSRALEAESRRLYTGLAWEPEDREARPTVSLTGPCMDDEGDQAHSLLPGKKHRLKFGIQRAECAT